MNCKKCNKECFDKHEYEKDTAITVEDTGEVICAECLDSEIIPIAKVDSEEAK